LKIFGFFNQKDFAPRSRGGIAALGRFCLAKPPALRAGLQWIGDLTVWFSKWDAKRLPKRQFDLRPLPKVLNRALFPFLYPKATYFGFR
jgi:hypothetical protein